MVTAPCEGVAQIEIPVGEKAGNMQVFKSSVVAVFKGTVIKQFAGAGTPMVKGTVKVPIPAAFVTLNTTDTGPGEVGVPEIKPVAAFRTSPAGNALPD